MGSVLSNTAKWLNAGLKDRVTHDSVQDKRGYFINHFATREVDAHNSKLLQRIGCRNAICWMMTTLGILAVGMVLLVGMHDDKAEGFPATRSPFSPVPTSSPTSSPTTTPTASPTSWPTASPTYVGCVEKLCSSQADCEAHPNCNDDGFYKVCYPDENAASPHQGKCNQVDFHYVQAPGQYEFFPPSCLSFGDHDTTVFDIESDTDASSFLNRRSAICSTDDDCNLRNHRLGTTTFPNPGCDCPSNQTLICKTKNIILYSSAGDKTTELGFCACDTTHSPTPLPTSTPTSHPTLNDENFFDLQLYGQEHVDPCVNPNSCLLYTSPSPRD